MRILLLVAALAVALLVACSSKGGGYRAPQTISISPEPTRTAVPTRSTQPGVSGFGQEAVNTLLGYLRDDAARYGWVAGCIWNDGVADNDTLYPARLLGLDLSNVASGTWGFSSAGIAYHVATIYHPRGTQIPPVADFIKTETAEHLCYSPPP